MASTCPLEPLTVQDLLILLWPVDLGWPEDIGALAIGDPIGADHRLATVRR
jgi:hypothetical protein